MRGHAACRVGGAELREAALGALEILELEET
jgi:hypothetical protein